MSVAAWLISHQPEARELAYAVAQHWYDDGEWDEGASVQSFGPHHFILAEDWKEITLSEYVNLRRSYLRDCTPGYVTISSYGEDIGEADYIRYQTRGL